jgi:cytochrome c biogenesis protein CcmG/thiol:disulfide interchange protein DsbE
MKGGRILPLAIAGAFVALVGYALLRGKPETPDAMIGRQPAAVSLAHLVDGSAQPASEFAPKGPVVVNFWASWCAPCKVEHPIVDALAKSAGAPVIGIAYRDAPQNAAAYLKELGNPYAEIRLDPEGQGGFSFGLKGVPETFVIGADGKILARVSGALTPENVEKQITPALVSAGVIKPQ